MQLHAVIYKSGQGGTTRKGKYRATTYRVDRTPGQVFEVRSNRPHFSFFFTLQKSAVTESRALILSNLRKINLPQVWQLLLKIGGNRIMRMSFTVLLNVISTLQSPES